MGFLSLMFPLLRHFGTLLVCLCSSHPCPSKQGLEGSCAVQVQGHFQRAGRDTGYQLCEILVRENQENPTVPAVLWSMMEQRCPSSLPWSSISSHVRGAAGPWVFLGVSQGAGCFRPLCLSVAQAKTLLWPDQSPW